MQDLRESLKIVGQSASLYHDDVTAAWLENQQHLQLWMENKEEDLWIDRYDVRQLLSDASLFAKCVVPYVFKAPQSSLQSFPWVPWHACRLHALSQRRAPGDHGPWPTANR